MTTTLDISLNGERLATEAPNLQALLQARGYDLKNAMACAINSSFVPRPLWPERELQNGDRIDVVTPITGG
jgi:sulfur carrier protein